MRHLDNLCFLIRIEKVSAIERNPVAPFKLKSNERRFKESLKINVFPFDEIKFRYAPREALVAERPEI